ncbi:hypothetical protein F4561_005725 [Lipingzhangella halophila]|uniref:Uncharacterized protein n=1 Tax=Lipingzhangella halophila TaxID=1783352 RepID=A0A7W7W5I8_9ACTN|nr:hypothetical protein [Lipingzhangella halophila]
MQSGPPPSGEEPTGNHRQPLWCSGLVFPVGSSGFASRLFEKECLGTLLPRPLWCFGLVFPVGSSGSAPRPFGKQCLGTPVPGRSL